ncbi:sulfurtransferase [Methylotuvimicrobium buryatense]|uniref:Sulfurtransferase n=1 Tax=Methylotuvimicrobium buryatense TaxID=95641 RepID=A0A4P9UPB5_METBY|nr:sulfurtransferase [Methylotuvimicrobium buryatense]QCW82071.1 sulfurtransferase [Methylotuvimicrobium buryatense]
MAYTNLIPVDQLAEDIGTPGWVVFDCRFSLADTEAGGKAYRQGHIPGARYVHLDRDLSSGITDLTGRHPLPDFNSLCKKLGAWGVSNASQVVVYDDADGAFAGRLWWLLRCLGHDRVAVLDGGIQQWRKGAYPITTALPSIQPALFRPYLNDSNWLSAQQVQNGLARKSIKLIDARTPERFSGRQEPIDPVAGHVPGALNRPFQFNLQADGRFKATQELRDEWSALIGVTPAEHVVHMCGSGVTACHNLLAMDIAGLSGSKLYAGSWSEWIRNKNRPVATEST